MLSRLSIRDLVLIDRLELAFASGFSALTGETGAGKSILLDALGLVLGDRGDARLVRPGSAQAVISAAFEVGAEHPVRTMMSERGLDGDGPVIVRRVLTSDGRGRAFVNDQPATMATLRELGASLVQILGQGEQHSLSEPASHREALDAFGGHAGLLAETAEAHRLWRARGDELRALSAAGNGSPAEDEYLRHALAEIDSLAPQAGEEEALQTERTTLANRERLVEALDGAQAEMGGQHSWEAGLRAARRHLERVAGKCGALLDESIAALDRISIEVGELAHQLAAARAALEGDPRRLAAVDDRLFALRALARKHRVPVAKLASLREEFAQKVRDSAGREEQIRRCEKALALAWSEFAGHAQQLSTARRSAAARLDAAIVRELPALKLEKARFSTAVETLPESEWNSSGCDRVSFLISANPGSPLGELARVASGGELASFLLALKVVLARCASPPTIVFDEVDSGIGGATAAAVGERLTRLGADLQVLAVTHSPQVAARAEHHLLVEKKNGAQGTTTRVAALRGEARREEIARMLAGARISEEARRAADVLLGGARR
jgi:DNA repair protein RecN (Recombination protein N)